MEKRSVRTFDKYIYLKLNILDECIYICAREVSWLNSKLATYRTRVRILYAHLYIPHNLRYADIDYCIDIQSFK